MMHKMEAGKKNVSCWHYHTLLAWLTQLWATSTRDILFNLRHPSPPSSMLWWIKTKTCINWFWRFLWWIVPFVSLIRKKEEQETIQPITNQSKPCVRTEEWLGRVSQAWVYRLWASVPRILLRQQPLHPRPRRARFSDRPCVAVWGVRRVPTWRPCRCKGKNQQHVLLPMVIKTWIWCKWIRQETIGVTLSMPYHPKITTIMGASRFLGDRSQHKNKRTLSLLRYHEWLFGPPFLIISHDEDARFIPRVGGVPWLSHPPNSRSIGVSQLLNFPGPIFHISNS